MVSSISPTSLSSEGRTSRGSSTKSHQSLGLPDLEKAETIPDQIHPSSGSDTTSARVTRAQSLVERRRRDDTFNHQLSHIKTSIDVLVEFDGPDDPYQPLNWPLRKKIITTALYGFTTMGITFASSVYSPAIPSIAAEFNVSTEVSLLGLSMILLGFGLGPLIHAPLSEVYGRKVAVLVPYFLAAVFCFATAAAKDIQTIIITRFFAGFFGSAPVTNTGGVLGDIWDPKTRGTATVFYAFAVIGGPIFGPIVGGAMLVRGVDWIWTELVTGIFMLIILTLDILILDESYPPVLLVYKARRLRISTGNWSLHARHEEWDVSISELGHKFLVRPFQMLATPICFFMALYASFVYGILYANLAVFPLVFQVNRGWNELVAALPFLGLLLGMILAGLLNIYNQSLYNKRYEVNGNKVVPEARLMPMMVTSVFYTAGLFLFGWTSDPSYHWMAPVMGAVLIGFGFLAIFQSALNYLIDTFPTHSASAVAANTFLRSMFALSFPLFVNPMYGHLGIPLGTSVFAIFSAILIPIPFLFYIYGPRLRKWGKYSATMDQLD